MPRQLFSNIPFLLFDAPDSNAPSGDLSKGGILDELMKDDGPDEDILADKKVPPTSKSDKSDESEEEEDEDSDDDAEKDELSELEDELNEDEEEVDTEKLELVTPVRRKEILKKYPKLFEDFPYLEKAYYREQQYTEILPTIDDARDAKQAVDTLGQLDKDLLQGNFEPIVAGMKENPAAFAKFVDNYLPTLAKVDTTAYHHVLGNVIKNTIIAMVDESNAKGNESLKAAAQLLNQFVFGSSKWVAPTKLSNGDTKPEDNSKEAELADREKKFIQTQISTISTELDTKINNQIKSTISNHIDPKDSLSEYVRKNAVRDVMEELDGIFEKDQRFNTIKDKLWEEIIKSNFNPNLVSKLRSAYLAKAKTVLPALINKARKEALKGSGKRVADDKNEPYRGKPSEHSNTERSRSNNSDNVKGPRPGESTLEFLSRD